jgi:hypothetical protein
MKRQVEAHFGFIVGLMAQHEACRGDAYFTPGGQSYPQAGSDFPNITDGLSAAMIVNQLMVRRQQRQSLLYSRPAMSSPTFCHVSN